MNTTAATTTSITTTATTTSTTTATTVTAAVVVELLAWVAPCQPPCTVLSTSPGYPEFAGVLPYSPSPYSSSSPYASSSPYPSSPYASASNSSPYSATSSTAYLDVEASDNLQLGLLNYWLNGVLTILTVVLGVLG